MFSLQILKVRMWLDIAKINVTFYVQCMSLHVSETETQMGYPVNVRLQSSKWQ